jgi:hypothetical protein
LDALPPCCFSGCFAAGSYFLVGCFATLLFQRMLCRWVVLLGWMLCHLLLDSGGCCRRGVGCYLWADASPLRLWMSGGCFVTVHLIDALPSWYC